MLMPLWLHHYIAGGENAREGGRVTHPLEGMVLMALGLLDPVPVRLARLVVSRVVLGLGHGGARVHPLVLHHAKGAPRNETRGTEAHSGEEG